MGTDPRSDGLFSNVNMTELAPPFHLSVREFNDMLLEHGSGAEWRKAVWCPCIRIDNRQASSACEDCRGKGVLYPEHLREPLIILDTSRTSTMRYAAAGLMADGQIEVTFPCGIIPGQHDMLLPDEDVHVVNQVLFREMTRRLDDRDHLHDDRRAFDGAVKQQQIPRNERLLYPTDVCVEEVFWRDEAKTLHSGRVGTHYTLGPENEWIWTGSHGPPPGMSWSVRYRAPAAYLIQGSGPMLRREAGDNMPYRVSARRLDKVGPDDLR